MNWLVLQAKTEGFYPMKRYYLCMTLAVALLAITGFLISIILTAVIISNARRSWYSNTICCNFYHLKVFHMQINSLQWRHFHRSISHFVYIWYIWYIYDKRVEIVLYVYGSCLINASDCWSCKHFVFSIAFV